MYILQYINTYVICAIVHVLKYGGGWGRWGEGEGGGGGGWGGGLSKFSAVSTLLPGPTRGSREESSSFCSYTSTSSAEFMLSFFSWNSAVIFLLNFCCHMSDEILLSHDSWNSAVTVLSWNSAVTFQLKFCCHFSIEILPSLFSWNSAVTFQLKFCCHFST